MCLLMFKYKTVYTMINVNTDVRSSLFRFKHCASFYDSFKKILERLIIHFE